MRANWIHRLVLGGLALAASQALAQLSLEAAYRGTGTEMARAFEAQRKVLQVSSALIQDGRTEAGYGIVISAGGHILVKASEYAELEHPEVIVDRQRYREVKWLATDAEWDVSLIQVDAEGLVPVVYAPTSEVPMGSWVVTNGVSSRIKRRLLSGVVSAKIREVSALGGLVLGLVLNTHEDRLSVAEVPGKGGGHDAGFKAGDVILSLDAKELVTMEDLVEALKAYHSGERVPVKVQRGDAELVLEVKLMTRDETYEGQSRNDAMSGDFSARRSDFPRVLQHSILGNSKSVGGPVLDLGGRCLGMNIARASRAESFAIPVEDLQAIAARLMATSAAQSER